MTETLLEPSTLVTMPNLVVPIGTDEIGAHINLDMAKCGNCMIDFPKWMTPNHDLVNNISATLLSKNVPQHLRFILVDQSEVGLNIFDGVTHLLTPVIKDTERVISALQWSNKEILKRMTMFEEVGVKSIEEYNQKAGFMCMEYICIVIFDLTAVMYVAPSKLEDLISQINIAGRQAGFVMVATTKHPRDRVAKNFLTKITYKGDDEVGIINYLQSRSDASEKIRLNVIPDIEIGKVIQSCTALESL